MKASSEVDIIEVADNPELERFLFGCIFHSKFDTPMDAPYRRHKHRAEYLKRAIPTGFRKKILFLEGDHIGMIEYAPAEASGLPIVGENFSVMNCIWVHSRAQGYKLDRRLTEQIIESEKQAAGFATLALEDHWMIWMRKSDVEKLGFRSTEAIEVKHKTYHSDRSFKMHPM